MQIRMKVKYITEEELQRITRRPPWWRGPMFMLAGFGIAQLIIWYLSFLR